MEKQYQASAEARPAEPGGARKGNEVESGKKKPYFRGRPRSGDIEPRPVARRPGSARQTGLFLVKSSQEKQGGRHPPNSDRGIETSFSSILPGLSFFVAIHRIPTGELKHHDH
ncbi:MAG: hypothetical protein ACP5NB_13030, partial [Chloroflexia bacterium]